MVEETPPPAQIDRLVDASTLVLPPSTGLCLSNVLFSAFSERWQVAVALFFVLKGKKNNVPFSAFSE